MDARMVRVSIEMDLVEGVHFPEDAISERDIIDSAKQSFIDWLDSWCGETKKDILEEYIQAKLVYK